MPIKEWESFQTWRISFHIFSWKRVENFKEDLKKRGIETRLKFFLAWKVNLHNMKNYIESYLNQAWINSRLLVDCLTLVVELFAMKLYVAELKIWNELKLVRKSFFCVIDRHNSKIAFQSFSAFVANNWIKNNWKRSLSQENNVGKWTEMSYEGK